MNVIPRQSEDKGRNKLVEKQAMSRVMVRFRDSVATHALCPVCTRGFGPGEQEACLNNIDENLKVCGGGGGGGGCRGLRGRWRVKEMGNAGVLSLGK